MTGTVLAARNAVALSFALNGFGFATWVSRIPEVRGLLGLSNGQLGLLLLAISAGSVLTLPTTGALINRFGAGFVVRVGVTSVMVGQTVAALAAAAGSTALTALGLFLHGLGIGIWDVAMNVEGASVERRLGRNIMPRFHAAFSLGTVLGAGLGALTTGAGVPLVTHLVGVAVVSFAVIQATTGRFLAREAEVHEEHASRSSALAAWVHPRTLLVGLMVFALALTEGTANDWLALALIDGYGVEEWVGVLGFAGFVSAMTLGRVVGPVLLDRYGRVPVLWSTIVVAGAGVLLVVFGQVTVVVTAGIVLWGLGASLGFPVGMSAASDDPVHAASRVSVVSSIAYTAFLAGPPLLGFVADEIGTLRALLVVAVLLVPSALVVPSAREPKPARDVPDSPAGR